MLVVQTNIGLQQVRRELETLGGDAVILVSARTFWWSHTYDHATVEPGIGLPLDPTGGPLLIMGDASDERHWRKYLELVEAKQDYYGRYGLTAFEAMHHLNSFDDTGRHWASNLLADYERALDALAPPSVADDAHG